MKRHHYLRNNTSKICKSTFCHNQLPFTPNDPFDKYFPKVLCCEETPTPADRGYHLIIWDTHPDQISDRLYLLAQFQNLKLNVIVNSLSELVPLLAVYGEKYEKAFFFTLILSNDSLPFINHYIGVPNLYVYLHHSSHLNYSQLSSLNLSPPPFSEIFDLNTSRYSFLNSPYVLYHSPKNNSMIPEASIIIPSFQHAKELKRTLKSLSKSNLKDFETIIVNTGPDRETSQISRDYLSKHSGLLIDLEFERKLGDFENTLAFARNLGARQASGSILVFMDSDIISEKDFLQNLVSAHGHSEVVVPRRVHEVKLKSRFLNVMRKQHRSQDSYWLKFYEANIPMSEMEAPWRYVSGFCMSLKKDLFFEISGFSNSFVIYAFEDVDLAYQAFQKTNKFFLMDDIVIHQDHHVYRSDYRNIEEQRQLLLKECARHFYRLNLKANIIKEHSYYLNS